jgi:hypothetical protein
MFCRPKGLFSNGVFHLYAFLGIGRGPTTPMKIPLDAGSLVSGQALARARFGPVVGGCANVEEKYKTEESDQICICYPPVLSDR